ncbi:sigma 54-interacting transcriptional regulator [Flammeovirga yaeyamensis]|uniref:Sigma 54-interacting transcriptional regulator n=1 Tax=Flammeovirga yaeyamensis TaxID=367791 RepID=A0AAX1NAD9_9BACT|nr:sigma-54 dependent transcriptional regulator [Flammeovirga yaeyamensis]MBB3698006.1 DNA-binding NtrC family response regulator [Flammeovirga yaeyamensis]NMF35642.1 sigma-54-dependent Fis family transcriptional regulator [Flammeovirga yaeyamensis]QWG03401.1 sigma 54-interacting transcriptional regulator [Flammeovirga yaeyamensis]
MPKKILIIDDEKSIRYTLREILEFENYEVDEAKDGEEALEKLVVNNYDVALCDVKMPKKDGIEVLTKAMEMGKAPQFIMISAHANIDIAVDATKKGAFDFISKPPDLNRLLLAVRNALDKNSLVQETKVLKKQVAKKYDIIGESAPVQLMKDTIEKVAPTEARVLVTGPNGAGKELVARWIHGKSPRSKQQLVEVNCAAIPSELIESELFGHEKGSFTSAHKQRIGKFEQANEGTLFLDEIGDMSLSAQAKVLRALQENRITRVGGDKEIKVNVRVVAATNKDLKAMIKSGDFREDLYHRLSVIVIKVPSLSDRKDDIPLLVKKFLKDIAGEYGKPETQITEEALEKLKEPEWTGNIRELRNVVERLTIMSPTEITKQDVEMFAFL